jgi:hypothetical protein
MCEVVERLTQVRRSGVGVKSRFQIRWLPVG